MLDIKKKTPQLLLVLLILCGGLLRLIRLDNPPLDFHPARQLHSALMARAFYLNHGGDLPQYDAAYEHEALMRGMQEPWIEPPILETVTSWGYRVIGDADLRLPRLLSILFWLVGALGMYRLASRMLNPTGALVSAAAFLFIPYGVAASRSFQPDPLMVMLMIWALDALCRWEEHPGFRSAFIAGLLCGMAILVKQVCVFPLGAAFLFFVFSARNCGKRLRKREFWWIILLALLPMAAYNLWGVFGSGFLKQQFQGRFYWREWLQPSFYIRWLRMIDQVFGPVLFVFALIGTGLIENPKYRSLWLGFLLGYGVYGLTLPHHIGTHDYYQLPLFPFIAVGIGALVERLFGLLEVGFVGRKGSKALLSLSLIFLLGWAVFESVTTLCRNDYRAWPQRWQTLALELEPYPNQISTIGIMDDYGAGMIYWGLRTPMIWDQLVEQLPPEQADATLRETMGNRDTLIVTDLERFYAQPRLQKWLQVNARLTREEPDYLIYDLRGED